jgi:spore coat polysaccharide biosynthesis predicted glycosyltransferase SpsG
MTARARLSVFFAAAAGPRRGFGHLVRCGVLADAFGCRRDIAIRGSLAMTYVALRLGWSVHHGTPSRLLANFAPDLLVVDDPSPARVREWVRHARVHGVRVVTLHDLGIARASSDLAIDGSIAPLETADLRGPRFAVVNPVFRRLRSMRRVSAPPVVVIALGGGAAARSLSRCLGEQLASIAPAVQIKIASGFADSAKMPPLPVGCDWLAPSELAPSLATASAAIVAGGMTLYEACALGTPVVALPLVPAQRKAIRTFVRSGAALSAIAATRRQSMARAVRSVQRLLRHPHEGAQMGRIGRALVDGRGTERVVRFLERATTKGGEARHVA